MGSESLLGNDSGKRDEFRRSLARRFPKRGLKRLKALNLRSIMEFVKQDWKWLSGAGLKRQKLDT